MSYDLYAVQAPASATDNEIAELAIAAAEAELPSDEPDSATTQRKRRLAAALRDVNPALAPFDFDFPAIAKSDGISESDARRLYRHIELNGPEDGNGIQIVLFDTWVSLAI